MISFGAACKCRPTTACATRCGLGFHRLSAARSVGITGFVLGVLAALPALAGPMRDLTDSLVVDGFSADFEDDEAVFGINEAFVRDGVPCVPGGAPACPPEESVSDAQWGFFNDVNQVHITWDANSLYVAVDGITWDNNMMLFLDITEENSTSDDRGPGLSSLVNVNAWRRNISFANDFRPDLFLATWDDNQTPQLWRYRSAGRVVQIQAAQFETAATFSNNAEGRAMEAAIPWSLVLQSDSTTANPAYGDTVPVLPRGFEVLRLAACVTAGGDGTGSPDAAPDNFSGFQVDGNAPATLDNFVIVPLDLLDATGARVPDGVPDLPGAGQSFEISIRDRVMFLRRPPVRGIFFSLKDMTIERGVVSPEEGHELEFTLDLEPDLGAATLAGRSVELSAEVYDLRGARRRILFRNQRVPVDEINDRARNRWDGRDDQGTLVTGGVYVLRVLIEPGLGQVQRSFAVIR